MISRPSLLFPARSAWADLAVDRRADTARSWWYWAVNCSRRDSCWVLTWFSWSKDMVSMFMALPPSEDEEEDMVAMLCDVCDAILKTTMGCGETG